MTTRCVPGRRMLASLYPAAIAAVLLCSVGSLALHAADASPSKPASPPPGDEPVQLNPFEVQASADNSYGALNSNSITRFNTDLNVVPVTADVFTEDFMRDVAVTSVEDLLGQYGTANGVSSSAPDSDASSNQPGDRIGNFQIGARGLTAGTVRRDGFVAVGSIANPGSTAVGQTSTFDVERVETIRGPQGLLYGASGAGATVNVVPKQARFDQTSASLMYRIDEYGSKIGQLDYNYGTKNVAIRLALLDQHQLYRRVIIGSETSGYYTQTAFRLPLKTTLRIEAEKTFNERINPTNPRFNVSNSNNDPRHNYYFTYLLAANLAGAVNPATGTPYPLGAINHGGLSWDNVNSWSGISSSEYVTNEIYSAKLQTQWTSWLSSEVAALYNMYDSDRIYSGLVSDAAPGFQSNPTGTWASASTPQDTEQPSRHRAFRGSLLATNHLFHDRATTQTLVGFDADYAAAGPTDYTLYQADSNWNVVTNGTSNLGRSPIGQQWWTNDTAPVEYGMFRPGWDTSRVTINGVNYIRMPKNPRNAAWVTPLNPLGLASLAGLSGISGSNNRGLTQVSDVTGLYGTNYTSWFDDKLGTLIGIRRNETYKRNPNTTAPVTAAYSENRKTNQSYNFGVNYAVRRWLRAYYSVSNTYNTPIANANDPLGNFPKTSSGTGQEAGLKFESPRAKLSGSFSYFWTNSKDEMINAGTGVRDLINPTGLNGSYPGPGGGKNQWVNLDRTTRGAELIVTASPTRNWRIRFSASDSDGTNLTDKVYPLLYNDQFYLKNGVVTFQDGTPFLVPTDNSTIASAVAKLNKQVDPATLQGSGTWAPLTLDMINTVNGSYWANPNDGNGHITGTNLTNVLKNFVSPTHGTALTGVTGLPVSAIQYTWADPNNSHGQTVVARKGEPTVGYAQYAFNLTQFYTFSGDHWFKGFGLGGSVIAGYKYRTYFYASPDGSRNLYRAPNLVTVNAIVSYTRKFKRVTWLTQLNINNVFNHYVIGILPNNGSGYTNPQNLQATFYGQPREFTWTNTFKF